MKQYEIVRLNKGATLSREKDLAKIQEAVNTKASEGWDLLQIVSPSDCAGAMYGVFVKDNG